MKLRQSARLAVIGLALLLVACGGPPPGEQAATAPADTGSAGALPIVLPGPKVFCAVTGTRESEADCAELAKGLAGLKAGVDAFRPEQPMVRDEPTIVRYSIEALPDIAQGDNGAVADPADPASQAAVDRAVAASEARVAGNVALEAERAQVEAGRITIGGRMFACLEGDPIFEIKPAACASYKMIETPNPVWEWQVTPKAGGRNYKLFLRSGIELEGADGTPRRLGSYAKTEEIRVDVSTLGKVQHTLRSAEAWIRSPLGVIAALTALVAAIGGLIAAGRKARGAKAPGGGKSGSSG